jgi:hypothetical protein
VQHCEGAEIADFACTETVSAVGSPGECVGDEETAGSVSCGEDACDSQSEFCRACSEDGLLEVACLPRQEPTWEEELQAQMAAGDCPAVAQLFLQCDATEDCPDGQVCVFSSGENGYAFCAEAGTFTYGVSCTTEADCGEDAPACGELDPFGYFAAFFEALGWMPIACGPAD